MVQVESHYFRILTTFFLANCTSGKNEVKLDFFQRNFDFHFFVRFYHFLIENSDQSIFCEYREEGGEW